MNIKDSPIAKLGIFGSNVAFIYKDMDVVWDFSEKYDNNNVTLDLMVCTPHTGTFVHRRSTFRINLPYEAVAHDLQVNSSVKDSVDELLSYADRIDSVHMNVVKNWLLVSGYMQTKEGWVRLLDGNYEE